MFCLNIYQSIKDLANTKETQGLKHIQVFSSIMLSDDWQPWQHSGHFACWIYKIQGGKIWQDSERFVYWICMIPGQWSSPMLFPLYAIDLLSVFQEWSTNYWKPGWSHLSCNPFVKTLSSQRHHKIKSKRCLLKPLLCKALALCNRPHALLWTGKTTLPCCRRHICFELKDDVDDGEGRRNRWQH